MGNKVYANGREVSCKSGSGKSICAFPDVCFTPPLTPATPPGVPLPYPNTGMDSDTTSGTKNVKISGKEVMLKNKSYFKTSTGDEAGSAPKKGIITSKIKGKVYFNSWSMDVQFEGENVVRHLDLTTHNHASSPGQTPPWPFAARMNVSGLGKDPCLKEKRKEKKACKGCKPNPKDGEDPCPPFKKPQKPKKPANLTEEEFKNDPSYNKFQKKYEKYRKKYEEALAKLTEDINNDKANECAKARRCKLVPFNAKKDGVKGCCPGQTPHHVIPKSSFFKISVTDGEKLAATAKYNPDKAPCICLEGESNTAGNHGLVHTAHIEISEGEMVNGQKYPFSQHNAICSKAASRAASHCSKKCLEHQVKEGHKKAGVNVDKDPKIKHSPSGRDRASAESRNYNRSRSIPKRNNRATGKGKR